MIPFIAIGGTWAWDGSALGQWYDQDSPWSANMRARGLEHHHLLYGDPRPFVWSTDLDGAPWRRWLGMKPKMNDWQAAGHNLFAYCVPPRAPQYRIPPSELHIIAHSHALQVVSFAAADGLRINTLITVGSPIRKDMYEVYERARVNIGFHWHFCSDGTDTMQWLGELGDGAFGIIRKHPCAQQNVMIPKVGHSGILHDMEHFADHWNGVIDLIRERHGRTDRAA